MDLGRGVLVEHAVARGLDLADGGERRVGDGGLLAAVGADGRGVGDPVADAVAAHAHGLLEVGRVAIDAELGEGEAVAVVGGVDVEVEGRVERLGAEHVQVGRAAVVGPEVDVEVQDERVGDVLQRLAHGHVLVLGAVEVLGGQVHARRRDGEVEVVEDEVDPGRGRLAGRACRAS